MPGHPLHDANESTAADLVTVVIPAWNAAATIDETLRSVRSQTHAALEILVVDDGSTDETAAIVRLHVAADERVRLLQQANSGVAVARNHGLGQALGSAIAWVDGDDLWAPTKIEEQLAVLRSGGDELALVYTWSYAIDARGFVTGIASRSSLSGHVLRAMCSGNFIGNGSAVLVKRSAALQVRGFDTSLTNCQDTDFYIRIAEHWHFGVVQKYLTGYRRSPDSMSSNGMRMYSAWRVMHVDLLARMPQFRAELETTSLWIKRWAIRQEVGARRYASMGRLGMRHPILMARHLTQIVGWRLNRHGVGRASPRPFPPSLRFPVGELRPHP